jgi:mono/diheme cytochrome c family protein
LKKKISKLLFAVFILFIICYDSFAQKDPKDKPGAAIFIKKCSRCHGEDGGNKLPGNASLQTSKLQDEEVLNKIARGGRIMPSWNNKLSQAEIRMVAEYVKGLRK